MPAKLIDISGQRFGMLVPIRRERHPNGKMVWLVRCDCGNETLMDGHNVRTYRSCGCVRGQNISAGKTRHGMTRTATYRSWEAMKRRCLSESCADYPEYGGRGIRVCERWLNFDNFLADMGPKPSRAHSIDRYPNNDGNYEPGNCRWATASEQAFNRRKKRSKAA